MTKTQVKTDSVQLLYDGKARFEYLDKQHRYLVSKQVKPDLYTEPTPVTGITTIIGIINKEALVQWAANTASSYMRDNWTPEVSLKALADEAKVAHKTQSNKAASIGGIGHKMIEALLLGKKIKLGDDEELNKALANISVQHGLFEDDFQPKTIHVEQPMYSLLYDFAGTDDRLCTINGKTILIDYKTSNRSYYNPDGIYASYYAQMGGQALLIEEQLGIEVDDCWSVNFAKDSEEYKYKRLSDLGFSLIDAKLYFLACLQLYNINHLFEWKVKG